MSQFKNGPAPGVTYFAKPGLYRETLTESTRPTVLPAKSDSDVMFCLQSYQGLIIDRSLVY